MSRLTREDWLDLGLKRLSEAGPDALKLDAICAAAKKTKGSFYHHFEDIEAFNAALVARWSEKSTADIIARMDTDQPVADQFEEMLDLVMTIDYRLELGIRDFARRDPDVQAAVITRSSISSN